MSEEDYNVQPETGPEIFESDPSIVEEPFFSYTRSFSIYERKRDEDVIEDTIDASKAFSKFACAHLDTSNHDFTEQASSTPWTKDTIFRTKPRHFEAPSERYKSITQELKELQSDIEALHKADGDYGANTMAEGVESLVATMQSLKASEKYASLLSRDFPLNEKEMQTKNGCSVLRDVIEKIENPEEEKEYKPQMKNVSYKFYGIAGGQSARTLDIIFLDRRLSALEETIGVSRLEMLPDIRAAVNFLSHKLNSLSKDKLKKIGMRMKRLLNEMANLEKDINKLAGTKKCDYQQKISQLYAMMGLWDQSAKQLPIIAARLQSIKDLSDACKGSKGQIQAAIREKDKNQDLLKENVDLLASTRKNFQDSLAQFKTMCDLQKDFTDLSKKMKKVR